MKTHPPVADSLVVRPRPGTCATGSTGESSPIDLASGLLAPSGGGRRWGGLRPREAQCRVWTVRGQGCEAWARVGVCTTCEASRWPGEGRPARAEAEARDHRLAGSGSVLLLKGKVDRVTYMHGSLGPQLFIMSQTDLTALSWYQNFIVRFRPCIWD